MQAVVRANEAAWSAEDGLPVKSSGGQSPEWTNRRYNPAGLWAYQPAKKPAVPPRANHPIDAFLSARMPEGLEPAPAADRVTLLRRATFDLLGLPPEPGEVDAFVNDPRPDIEAFAAVVDRLLESPHYGERMAQHWLDVTRYADTSGFANDYERGNSGCGISTSPLRETRTTLAAPAKSRPTRNCSTGWRRQHPCRLVRRVRPHSGQRRARGHRLRPRPQPQRHDHLARGRGCNAGHTIGATDELGMNAVEGRAHLRDFHVTLLRLLGLDDNRLTFYHAGRFKQLSQFGGKVISELIA